MIKEIEILRFLESKISYRIPRVLYAGLPSIRFKYHFGGFGRIDGVPLSRALYSGLSEEEKEVLARELAEFLKELHGFM